MEYNFCLTKRRIEYHVSKIRWGEAFVDEPLFLVFIGDGRYVDVTGRESCDVPRLDHGRGNGLLLPSAETRKPGG